MSLLGRVQLASRAHPVLALYQLEALGLRLHTPDLAPCLSNSRLLLQLRLIYPHWRTSNGSNLRVYAAGYLDSDVSRLRACREYLRGGRMGGSNFGYTDSWFGRLAFCQGQDLRVAENFN